MNLNSFTLSLRRITASALCGAVILALGCAHSEKKSPKPPEVNSLKPLLDLFVSEIAIGDSSDEVISALRKARIERTELMTGRGSEGLIQDGDHVVIAVVRQTWADESLPMYANTRVIFYFDVVEEGEAVSRSQKDYLTHWTVSEDLIGP
jgi:hypothetical protein